MKIRTRITLWVSLAGLVASAVFSLIVFLWGVEMPYEFLDQELEIRAHTITDELARNLGENTLMEIDTLVNFSHLYWVRIYDAKQQPIFTSQMAEDIAMPLKTGGQGYLVRTDIPLTHFYPEEEEEGATFWNRVFTFPLHGETYRIHIARPVEGIVEATIELALMISSALFISALLLIVVSYLVAGKILRPVREINKMTAEINANTLEKRIPLAHNGDEIDELAGSLNEMFNRLQYSFQRQKEFVANASHELKTPITLLRLSMEETLQDENLPVVLQEKLLSQDRALARMNQLVKSLLDLSRLELTESLQLETFSLKELIASVSEDFQMFLLEQHLTFKGRLDDELLIQADKEKIHRLLINLWDNAIRYNMTGGEIHCRAEADKGKITLTLANTGPGIPKEDQQRIFDQFYRCEKSRSIVHGGSGLGLTIVKRIVELHKGSITVESEPSSWTTITVVLPVL